MTTTTTSKPSEPSQQDLVDLQPDTESIYKRIIGPKVIILTFLSLLFISKNIYNIFVVGIPESQAPPTLKINTTVSSGNSDSSSSVPQNDSVMDRMYGYCIMTAVLFVVYLVLVKVNDRALMRKLEAEKKAEEEKERADKEQTDKQKQYSHDQTLQKEPTSPDNTEKPNNKSE